MWNQKKASVTIYGIMLALTIIILVLALAPVVRDFTNNARNETDLTDPDSPAVGMNCSTTDSDFTKAGCYMVDLSLFGFIGFMIFVAGAIVTARYIWG